MNPFNAYNTEGLKKIKKKNHLITLLYKTASQFHTVIRFFFIPQ